MVKDPIVIVVLIVALASVLFLPGLFYNTLGDYWDNLIQTISSSFIGLSIGIVVVNYYMSRRRGKAIFNEVSKLVHYSLEPVHQLLGDIDAKLKCTNNRTLSDIAQAWITNNFCCNEFNEDEIEFVLNYLIRHKEKSRESLEYCAVRCRDFAHAFSDILQPSEVAGLSQHAYICECLYRALNMKDITAGNHLSYIYTSMLHLTNNDAALKQEIDDNNHL